MGAKQRDGKKILPKMIKEVREYLDGSTIMLSELIKEKTYSGYSLSVSDWYKEVVRKKDFPATNPEYKKNHEILTTNYLGVRSLLDYITIPHPIDLQEVKVSFSLTYNGRGTLMGNIIPKESEDMAICKIEVLDMEEVLKGDKVDDNISNARDLYNRMVKALDEYYPEPQYLYIKAKNDLLEFMKVFVEDALKRGKIDEHFSKRFLCNDGKYRGREFIREVLNKTVVFNSDRAYYNLYNIFQNSEKLSLSARKKLRIQLANYLLDQTDPIYSIEVTVMNGSSVEEIINQEVEDETSN